MAARSQLLRQLGRALAGPPQGRARIAAHHGLHQGVEVSNKGRIFGRTRWAPGTGLSLPPRFERDARIQLTQAATDRWQTQPGRLGDPRRPTTPECPCLDRSPAPPRRLAHSSTKRVILLLEQFYDVHSESVA